VTEHPTEEGFDAGPARQDGRERRSERAERLLREVRLAEDEEQAAKSRHEAERMAETEAAYKWRRERAAAARLKYRRFLQSLAAGSRRGRRGRR
jgi:hypothetical protein